MPRRKQTQPMQRKNSDENKESEERLSETGDLDVLLDSGSFPILLPGVEGGEEFSDCRNLCSADDPEPAEAARLTSPEDSGPDVPTANGDQLSPGGGSGETGDADRHPSSLKGDFYFAPELPMRYACPVRQNSYPEYLVDSLPETGRMGAENDKENIRTTAEKTEKLREHENDSDKNYFLFNDIAMRRGCPVGGNRSGVDGSSPRAMLPSAFYAKETSSMTSSSSSSSSSNSSSSTSRHQSSVKQLESFVASVECREGTARPLPAAGLDRKLPAPGPVAPGVTPAAGVTMQTRKCKSSRLKHHAMSLPRLAKQPVPTVPDSMGRPTGGSQNCDPNQPLDLSVKTRPRESPASEAKYLSCSFGQDLFTSGLGTSGSSLADLEKKFGNTSAIFDRIGTKTWASPFCGALVSRLGMSLYNSKVHGGGPFGDPAAAASGAFGIGVIPLPVQRFNSAQPVPPPKSDASLAAVKSDQPDPVDLDSSGEPRSATGTDSGLPWHQQKHATTTAAAASTDPQRKHTNFQCSCGAELETLYHLTMHLQQTGHAPNRQKNAGRQEYSKLVRGQDMWLNHGCEQTRQILRCMECDESFKSLPELTVHMIQTKHYANIVGTEALQKKTATTTPSKGCEARSETSSEEDEGSSVHCLVCLETFDNPEALGDHIVEVGHYKDSPGRGDGATKEPGSQSGRSWQNSRSMTPVGATSPQSGMDDDGDSLDTPLLRKTDNDRKRYHSASEGSLIDDTKEPEVKGQGRSARHSDSEDVPMKYKRFDENGPSSVIRSKSPSFNFKDSLDLERPRSPVEEDSLAEDTHLRSPGFQQRLSGRLSDVDKSFGRPQEDQVDPGANSSAFQVENFFRPSSNSSSDGSAIRAMETFIKKSFGTADSKNRLPTLNPMDSTISLVGSLMTRFGCYADQLGQAPTGRPGPETLESSKNLYQNKYLPPVYMAPPPTNHRPQGGEVVLPGDQFLPAARKIKREAADVTPKRDPDRSNHDPELPKRESEVPSRDAERPRSTERLGTANKRRQSQYQGHSSSPENYGKSETCSTKRDNLLSNVKSSKLFDVKTADRIKGELGELETEDRPSSTSNNNNLSRSSALESLQGLVYGKALNTEHPLDSLQKLIYGRGSSSAANPTRQPVSPGHLLNGSNGSAVIMKGPDALHHPLPPGTLILVNPIVTVVPGASGSNPSLNITLPGCESSLAEERGKPSELGGSRRNRSPTDDRENSLRVYRCRGCRRKFSSKGSYRYHLSRCHVLTSSSTSSSTSAGAEKCPPVKEPSVRKGPYACMPLDATAKFNKYYQLASELGTEAK